MILKYIVFSLTLSIPLAAQIFNVEKIRLDYPENKVLFGNVGTNFTYHNRTVNQQVPTKVLSGGLTGDLGYFSDEHLYMLINNYQILFVNDANVVNFGSTHARTQLFYKSAVSPEFFGQYQYDQARGLSLRLLAGAGPRWSLYKTETVSFALGTGLMFESEDWRDPVARNANVVYARYLKSSNYFSGRYRLNEQTDCNAVIYYQIGYDRDLADTLHRVSGEVNLAFKMFEKLSFTAAFSAAWESRPIIAILPFVFNITNGVRYKF